MGTVERRQDAPGHDQDRKKKKKENREIRKKGRDIARPIACSKKEAEDIAMPGHEAEASKGRKGRGKGVIPG